MSSVFKVLEYETDLERRSRNLLKEFRPDVNFFEWMGSTLILVTADGSESSEYSTSGW
jgi:hypothetical protein